MNTSGKERLGFIGQGWIGKNLADHFQERGFECVRYALDPEFVHNKETIAGCDIVFIAVPTPTTREGFDAGLIRAVLPLVGEGKVAVIKSTILPDCADTLAYECPHCFVLHSPEFLREASVRFDIDNPDRNIVGVPARYIDMVSWREKAEQVLTILPRSAHRATHNVLCTNSEAAFIKHGGNDFLCIKTVFMNILYDLVQKIGGSWDTIAQGMMADPRIGASHMFPVHQHAHMQGDTGRGAGGHCFPKDFAALRQYYERLCPEDKEGILMLRAIEAKNNRLLVDSGKDLDILRGIYGSKVFCICDAVGNAMCTCGVPTL